jgi:DNA-directed RNA polymerase subunit RPC12/RpoP
MQQYGYNRFKCCGKILAARYNHCPECGFKIPRPEDPSEATSILMKLDDSARRAEAAAQFSTDKGNEWEYTEEHSECFNDERCYFPDKECPKCSAKDEKETWFKAASTHGKKALWHRSVYNLIRSLLSNK